MTNLDDIRQEIYEVLNVHNPTDCGGGRCWGVEEIEKIIADQVREAKLEVIRDVWGEDGLTNDDVAENVRIMLCELNGDNNDTQPRN